MIYLLFDNFVSVTVFGDQMDGLARQYARIPEIKKSNSLLRIQNIKSSQNLENLADRVLIAPADDNYCVHPERET